MLKNHYECGSEVFICNSGENYYHTQRNNKLKPFSACNITSLNMVFDYFGINKYTDDDVMRMTMSEEIENWYRKTYMKTFGIGYLKNKKLNLIWKVLEEIANKVFCKEKYNIRSIFTTFDDVSAVTGLLQKTNAPIMVSTRFTRSGHIIIINGFSIRNNIIDHYVINDPYGNPLTKYKYGNGRCVRIPTFIMGQKLKLDRGLIFTAK